MLTTVHEKHLAQFRIPVEILKAAGVRSVSDADVRELLGVHGRRGQGLSGIYFPYFDPVTGKRTGARVRLDHPDEDTKYLMEQGCRALYFAPGDPADLQDVRIPAVIAEAEKSALAISAFGTRRKGKLLCIAMGGVWGWKRKNGIRPLPDGSGKPTSGPSPSFDLVKWMGRTVFLVFDSSVKGRSDLEVARRALAEDLKKRGARVLIATVPKLKGVNGPDDLIAVAGDDALFDALNNAAEEKTADCPAQQAIDALETALHTDKNADVMQAIKCVAGIADPARRELLMSRIAALRSPGVNLKFVRREVERCRGEAETQRQQAAAKIQHDNLLALGATVRVPELLDKVCGFVRRFVSLSKEQADVAASWIAHTHAFDAAEHTPYLSITSPTKRSGKSRLLEVFQVLVARPWYTGRVSAAVLPRKIELDQPTLLLDESDTALSGQEEYSEVLRGILNMGHRRGGVTTVCVKVDGDFFPHDFSTFCPKAIAGIGKLPDTVADRSIAIRMKRKMKGEKVERFRLRDEKLKAEAEQLRRQLAACSAANLETLRDARPELPEPLTDRQQDGVEPLLAIADLAGGEWPEKARCALLQLCAEAQASDDSISVQLLSDIRAIFQQRFVDKDRISSAELASALAELEESPWATWNRGKPITPAKLARMLGSFGIVSGDIRFSDTKVLKGYYAEVFADPWSRYLPSQDTHDDISDFPLSKRNNVTTRINTNENGDFESATSAPCCAWENGQIASTGAPCSGVALSRSEIEQGDSGKAFPSRSHSIENNVVSTKAGPRGREEAL